MYGTRISIYNTHVCPKYMSIIYIMSRTILLRRDYVYSMQVVVSTLFRVMYFNHGEEIVSIDQLDFLDPSPNPTRDQVFPLLIPSVSIDTTLPQVSYVASCPLRSITIDKKPLFSCLPSWDLVPTVDQVIYPMGALEPSLHPIDPTKCSNIYSI